MKPLILALMLVSPLAAPGAAAVPAAQADWRRDGLDDRVKAALTGRGWRLEDDGRALDPEKKAPASQAELAKAVLDLRRDAQRAALEKVQVMLASGKPLTGDDRRTLETLASDLPPGLVSALADPKSDLSLVRRMAGADLARVAAYFDGARTMAERRAAAQPIAAETSAARPPLPYYSARERSVGDKLRASVEAELGRDPVGRQVLSRLAVSGRPDLPPILLEDQSAGVAAQYDFRRRAVVLDRESAASAAAGTAPPPERAALKRALSTRAALLAYLDAHPEAVAAAVRENDVVIVHELTHAWQDRRDPIFREMARGNLPDTQPLEYEEEAYETKNLYLHSKVLHDPASVKLDPEFDDYRLMLRGASSWRAGLDETLVRSAPSRALPLKTIAQVQAERLSAAASRPAGTRGARTARALDLQALGRSSDELARLRTEHSARMAALAAETAAAGAGRLETLGRFYLIRAGRALNGVERLGFLDQAEAYAAASGNGILLQQIRDAKEQP